MSLASNLSAPAGAPMTVRRGDVFFADLDPVIGSEQGGTRPVLVVQNNTGNRYSPTTIVAAITSVPKALHTHVCLPGAAGLPRDSVVLLEQLRTIDRRRLQRYVGQVDRETMAAIDQALLVSLGITGPGPPTGG